MARRRRYGEITPSAKQEAAPGDNNLRSKVNERENDEVANSDSLRYTQGPLSRVWNWRVLSDHFRRHHRG
jgi:hypothetical protein